jgi:hypothetical protein
MTRDYSDTGRSLDFLEPISSGQSVITVTDTVHVGRADRRSCPLESKFPALWRGFAQHLYVTDGAMINWLTLGYVFDRILAALRKLSPWMRKENDSLR